MPGFFYYIKIQFLTALAYRFNVFATMIGRGFHMLAATMIWKAAYSGIDEFEGLREGQMLTYAILSVAMATFYNIKSWITGDLLYPYLDDRS